MSRIRPPENIEIASLKKKQEMGFNAMAPGPGTPWEDRGTHGVVGAFLKTCKLSLTSPAMLTDSIRRPETTGDARGFVIGCSIFWGISAFIHGLLLMSHYNNQPDTDFDSQTYIIFCVIAMLAAGVGAFLLFQLYNSIYSKLVEKEKTQALLPDVLLYNVNAYAFGPSILAVIPIAGPPLALLWIFIDCCIVGAKRLRIRVTGSIIDALLAFIVVLAVGLGAYWAGDLLLDQIANPVTPIDKTNLPAIPR